MEETVYNVELHIWIEHAEDFEKCRGRIKRLLGKYPGKCGVVLFAMESGKYLELPDCSFDIGEEGLVAAVAARYSGCVDIVLRASARPAGDGAARDG